MSNDLSLALPVSLKMTWWELFGEKQVDMPDGQRRKRWERWKELAEQQGGKGPRLVEIWTDTSSCHQDGGPCKHLCGDWCRYSDLPVTVNPVLTMRHNTIGMACMGIGYEPREVGTDPWQNSDRGQEVAE